MDGDRDVGGYGENERNPARPARRGREPQRRPNLDMEDDEDEDEDEDWDEEEEGQAKKKRRPSPPGGRGAGRKGGKEKG